MDSLADLRKEYTKAALDVSNVLPHPAAQFEQWFREASQSAVPEPNAMTLATANEKGMPSARIVLLKGVEQGRFVFYTNYQSEKGRLLDANPACALTFFWPELERQVRIEGIASRVAESRSVAYFQSRPRGSQIGAWASPQSTPIDNRDILEQRAAQLEKKFEGAPVLPKPHQWGGYEVEPLMVEFWQGRPSRLHDRIRYNLVDGAWKVVRLAP